MYLKTVTPLSFKIKKNTGVTLSKILLCTDNLKKVVAVLGKSDESRIDLSCKVGDFSLGYITIIGS